MKNVFVFVLGLVLIGVFASLTVVQIEEVEIVDMHDLQFCDVQTVRQWNKTYYGELGKYNKVCGLQTTCEIKCRYLSDSCITEKFCSKIKSSGISLGNNENLNELRYGDSTNIFCGNVGSDTDFCKNYLVGK